MKKNSITDAELQRAFADIDLLRTTGRYIITDEQYRVLKYAREGNQIVPFPELSRYFRDRGWLKISPNSLRALYIREAIRRGEKDSSEQ